MRRPQAAQCPSRRHTDPPNQIGGGGESPPQGNPIKGRKGGKASPNEYAPFATMAAAGGRIAQAQPLQRNQTAPQGGPPPFLFQCQQLQQPCRMTIEKVLSEDSTICCGSAIVWIPYLAQVGVQVAKVLRTGLMQFLSVHVVRIRVRSTVNDRVTVRT